MKILVADDDKVGRRVVEALLAKWGHEVITADDGDQAWEIIQKDARVRMALLDWQMPGLDGLDVIRKAKKQHFVPFYSILVTMRAGKFSHIDALEAGADDYVSKPFDPDVLWARIKSGIRTIELESDLVRRIAEVERSLAAFARLAEVVPVCPVCGSVRDHQGQWHKLNLPLGDVSRNISAAKLCPECAANCP